MKQLLTFLLLLTTNVWATNELDRALQVHYQKNGIVVENKSVDDYTLVRRIYLDIAGRIPTLQEIKVFVEDRSPDKRQRLVEKILYSEDYVNNFYNFFADLLRIRPDRLADNIQMKSYPYMEYIRDSLRSNKPYDIFVKELLTATGKPTENGATGYILRDDGMTFDNISLTTQIFIANAQNCNVCHDDPFSDKTMQQFYQLAAFFDNDNRENRKDYQDILRKIDDEIKIITKTDRIDNGVRQLMSANLIGIHDNPAKTVKYPADYKYDNAKPGEIAVPVSLDGTVKGVIEGRRSAIARWIVSQSRFEQTITNRLWIQLVGVNLFYPQIITDTDIASAKNKEVILLLSNYLKTNGYSLKSLVRLIVQSDFYSRPAFSGLPEDYKFQGIVVKRLSAHQLWDSIITLILDDPNYTRISFDEYSTLFKIDWQDINGQKILDRQKSLREWDNRLLSSFLKYKGVDLVRSAYNLRGNQSFISLFLKEFGASERLLLDTTNDKGTVTQVLTLMNSPLMEVITDKKSQVMKSNDRAIIFTSIMARPLGIIERPLVEKLHNNDLVWVLLNSNEFLFRK